MSSPGPDGRSVPVWLIVLGGLFLVFVGALVYGSFSRPSLLTFPPTPPAGASDSASAATPDGAVAGASGGAADAGVPGAPGRTVTGRITLDARRTDEWVFFDFSRAAPVSDPASTEWDLAARRFHLIVNGGKDYGGRGGVRRLGHGPHAVPAPSGPPSGGAGAGPASTADSLEVPSVGYAVTTVDESGEPRTPPLEDWYRYDFFAHVLEPRSDLYAVRTADGRYAVVRFLSYYCPGAESGCVTFRYAYRPDGGRRFSRATLDTTRDATTSAGRDAG